MEAAHHTRVKRMDGLTISFNNRHPHYPEHFHSLGSLGLEFYRFSFGVLQEVRVQLLWRAFRSVLWTAWERDKIHVLILSPNLSSFFSYLDMYLILEEFEILLFLFDYRFLFDSVLLALKVFDRKPIDHLILDLLLNNSLKSWKICHLLEL